jgi:hypothetical protein
MNPYELNTLARLTVEDRIRQANRQRLVRAARSPKQPSAARSTEQPRRRHPRLWSLVHFRHAAGPV